MNFRLLAMALGVVAILAPASAQTPDLVALARPHLVDPYFTWKAAAWYGVKTQSPSPQYLSGIAQAYREADRTREKQIDLQRKAKPHRGSSKIGTELHYNVYVYINLVVLVGSVGECGKVA